MNESKLITDLAELRSAIRAAKYVCIHVYNEHGNHQCCVHLGKKEAISCAVERDKFDDYAAAVEGEYLWLNATHQKGLRSARLPGRLARRLEAALASRAGYERAGLSVPRYVQQEIDRCQPIPSTAIAA